MIVHIHAIGTKRKENCCCYYRGQRLKSIFLDFIILFKSVMTELLRLCILSVRTVRFQQIKDGV